MRAGRSTLDYPSQGERRKVEPLPEPASRSWQRDAGGLLRLATGLTRAIASRQPATSLVKEAVEAARGILRADSAFLVQQRFDGGAGISLRCAGGTATGRMPPPHCVQAVREALRTGHPVRAPGPGPVSPGPCPDGRRWPVLCVPLCPRGGDVRHDPHSHGTSPIVLCATGLEEPPRGGPVETILASLLAQLAAAALQEEDPGAVCAAPRATFEGGESRDQPPEGVDPDEEEGAAKAPPLAGAARLIGQSAGMRLVRQLLVTYARTDLPVLITGESGTGKELAARALHEEGRRASGSFVPENCAAIPRDLFESILFGHVRGAFTGAESDHEGLFRLASGGTLFLDEIGEMPLPLQAKLLRALQEREVRPVGGMRPVPADARVVAATNRDIEALLSSGRFREDLYYRLKGALIEIPPLRDRPEDIGVLAEHFLALASASRGGPPFRLSEDSLGILLRHDWPGNVRELANEIQRAVALADGDVIRPDPIARLPGQRPRQSASTRPALPAERVMIERTLRSCGGSVSAAAVEIGWNRQKLYRRMARLGVARGDGEHG